MNALRNENSQLSWRHKNTMAVVNKQVRKPYFIRYKGPNPYLDRENELSLEKEEDKQCKPGFSSFERLFRHATMNSARRAASYHPPDCVPKDRLDFVMESLYDPLENTFPEKGDPYIHVETVYREEDPRYNSWRVLRNRRIVVPQPEPHRGHPIVYGGLPERENISHVKLGITSDHSPQTNPGYSRTPSGSFYAI